MGQVAGCMGAGCLNKNNQKSEEELERKSVGTIFQPQQPLSPERKPLTKTSQLYEEDSTISTLVDHLRKSNIQEDDWKEEHVNAPSMIIRRGNKRRPKTIVEKKEEKSETGRSTVGTSNVETSDVIEGSVSEEPTFSRLTLNTREMDIEFMLPKSRAGPLVVPFIAYDKYQLP